jgi:hypothetical protein
LIASMKPTGCPLTVKVCRAPCPPNRPVMPIAIVLRAGRSAGVVIVYVAPLTAVER